MKRLQLIALSFSLYGCAAGQQLAAPIDDYEAYRKVRLAGSVEQRLAASWRYLKRMPDGWDPLESTCRHASLSIL